MKCSPQFRCTSGGSHLKKAEQRLKTCEECIFCREGYGQRFWEGLDSQGFLFIDFMIEQRTINAVYYSKLLKDRVKPVVRSKRRIRLVTSICLLHDKVRLHTATETVDETHGKVLPHPAYSYKLAPSDSHLFGPLKEALEGKTCRADDEVKILCTDG